MRGKLKFHFTLELPLIAWAIMHCSVSRRKRREGRVESKFRVALEFTLLARVIIHCSA